MKETQINWKSTDDEIDNMTIEQAIELLEKQIKLGESKNTAWQIVYRMVI